jgi:hypothetical protein
MMEKFRSDKRIALRNALMKALVVCFVITGCRQHPATSTRSGQEIPASSPSNADPHATKAAIDEMFDLRSHPNATIVHTVDPHSMTESQIKFGISPKRDPAVEYQPDVILMEQGDKAIKSIAGDGMTWTFDANAPQVSDFQEGKVVFATSRAVGRVLNIKRSGDTATVILGPVQITDVIRNGNFAMDQPIDMNNMISYVAPDYPEPPDTSADKSATSENERPDHVDEQFVLSRVSISGKWTPASMLRKFADGRRVRYRREGRKWIPDLVRTAQFSPYPSAGGTGPRLLPAGYANMQLPGLPGVGGIHAPTLPVENFPPAAATGQVPEVELQGVSAHAIAGKHGIGVQYLYNKNGLNLNAYGLLNIQTAGIHFFLHIKDAKIQDCGVGMNGAVGLKLHMNSSASQEFKVNFHKTLTLPIDLTIPLGAAGMPFELTFSSAFTVSTGYSARTSVLNAEGNYSFGGGVNAGYWQGGWRVTTPTDLKADTDLGNTTEGISVGINSLVMGFSVRTMVGIGAFGFSTGVYAGIRFTGTMLRAPDIGFPCRQGTIEAYIDSGVGYQLPAVITDAINFFLSPFTSHKVDRAGSVLRGPSLRLFHGDTQIPSKCSTPKSG